MKNFWNGVKWFFNHWLFANIVISTLVTLVTLILGFNNFYIIGMLTFAGYGVLVIIFINLRQLWWFITSTGDYEKKVDKKG
jgi:hypothetical protein